MNGKIRSEDQPSSISRPLFLKKEYLAIALAVVFFIGMVALRSHLNEKNEIERKQGKAIAEATRMAEDQVINLEKKREAKEQNQENEKELEIVKGIPKEKRITIYKEYMDRVWGIEKEAARRFKPGVDDDLNREFYRVEYKRQSKLLCEKYEITEKQLSVIHWEGETKWIQERKNKNIYD